MTKSAVIRGRIARRLKEAVALIVTRGAHVVRDENGEEQTQFKQDEAGGERWILPSKDFPMFVVFDLVFTSCPS